MMNLKHFVLPGVAALLLMSSGAQAGLQQSQQVKMSDTLTTAPENWFHLDPAKTGVAGISTELAYKELLKGKEPKEEVIVAVIDSGVDVEHEDLDDKVWVNEDEVAGNGVDDDKNGYVDDVHGWNFIGGADGQNVVNDTYELTRLYRSLSEKYKGKSAAEVSNKEEYALYQEVKQEFEDRVNQLREQSAGFLGFYARYKQAQKQMEGALGEDFTEEELKDFEPQKDALKEAKAVLQFASMNGLTEERIEEGNEYFTNMLEYSFNPDFDPRHIVGDDYSNLNERYYGNNDVEGPDASHGTHVAGIIAAERNNGIGIDGIAAPVKIMAIRAVPNGDERDKDVANAIYYAVDNGADIINMSFGKAYSPHKEVVDAAVKYAEEKGVLLVHAAGNDGKNIDEERNFPTKRFLNSKDKADNWLEVGASSWGTGTKFVADFSNYGRETVDVFAPGVDIYSTLPDNEYESMSGTSMAAPVTSGVAALIMAYYPELSAEEVKKIIMKSATNYRRDKVNLPGAEPDSAGSVVRFKKLSDSGKVVNVYEALERAEKKSR
ncbi:S8 family peptidase [Nafulsella turpanensis]|uniref:S8 family peptidase n=1 Tax=Nafulsella turpanensis TaxID=1265690 RepID=UPI000346CFCB|nr:S8 family peptidase [Nafulsella turpanensis]